MRVLLIENDAALGKTLVRSLQANGMIVDWVRNGATGFTALEKANYAAALIDIGVPKMSGLEVLKAARLAGQTTPALLIAARDSAQDIVYGLDLGADDYIVKPFEL